MRLKFAWIVSGWLFVLSLIVTASICGQDVSERSSTSYLQATVMGGTVWGHNEPVYHLAQSHPVGLQLEYLIHTQNTQWAQAYGYPHFGVSLGVLDYRNPKLGQSLSNLIFLQVPAAAWLDYRIGTGLGIHTRPFDLNKNHQNLMLGSRATLALYGQVNFRPSKKIPWCVGLGLLHFSNGSFTQPNSGINTIYLHSGFQLAKTNWPKIITYLNRAESEIDPNNWSPWSAIFNVSAGMVEKFPVGGRKYGVYQVQSHVQYRVGYKSGLYTGLTLKKNEAIRAYINENPDLGSSDFMLGLPIGHELYMGRLSMIIELGFYVYKRHSLFPDIYQRYGLRYQLNSNFVAGLTLNTHRAKAECFELSVGYRLLGARKKEVK